MKRNRHTISRVKAHGFHALSLSLSENSLTLWQPRWYCPFWDRFFRLAFEHLVSIAYRGDHELVYVVPWRASIDARACVCIDTWLVAFVCVTILDKISFHPDTTNVNESLELPRTHHVSIKKSCLSIIVIVFYQGKWKSPGPICFSRHDCLHDGNTLSLLSRSWTPLSYKNKCRSRWPCEWWSWGGWEWGGGGCQYEDSSSLMAYNDPPSPALQKRRRMPRRVRPVHDGANRSFERHMNRAVTWKWNIHIYIDMVWTTIMGDVMLSDRGDGTW